VYFVGIGGIGMSALAKYYLSLGASVGGSDLAVSEITEELSQQGVEIKIGRHKKSNVPKDATAVVHTSAIPHDNVELVEARQRGISVQTYPEALGDNFPFFPCIGVRVILRLVKSNR